jgi:hypothetical protein
LTIAPQSFEVPFVEKYRPVTLEDVVGKKTYLTCRQHTSHRAAQVDCQVWQHAQFDPCCKSILLHF